MKKHQLQEGVNHLLENSLEEGYLKVLPPLGIEQG